MARLVGATVGVLCRGKVVTLREQSAEPERAGGVAPVVGAPVRVLGSSDVPAVLEQHAEVRCAAGMTAVASR